MATKMTALTSLEAQVIQMLLEGENAVLAILRQQAGQVRASSRKMTGVGFFTDLALDPQAVRVAGCPSFRLGDVNGTAANVRHGLGFLLYVKEGVLRQLEGYTYDEPWPDVVRGLVLTYAGGANRNLDGLQRLLH